MERRIKNLKPRTHSTDRKARVGSVFYALRSKVAGFTIIELLTVIGIVAILGTVTTIAINPPELLAQGRDERRIADLEIVNQALGLTLPEGASFFRGVPKTIYLSLPDLSPYPGNCSGYLGLSELAPDWNYACAHPDIYQKINGDGWVPVNFENLSLPPTMASLPIDPNPDSSEGLYYSYVVDDRGNWELNANMESKRFRYGGDYDIESTDGGNTIVLYEVGTTVHLAPREVSARTGIVLRTPAETCGFDYNPIDSNYPNRHPEFYNRWTPPGSGTAVITKLWFYQTNMSLAANETVELAVYRDGDPDYNKISESVIATGTASAGWISSSLYSPIPISLGSTYIFGVGPYDFVDGFWWKTDSTQEGVGFTPCFDPTDNPSGYQNRDGGHMLNDMVPFTSSTSANVRPGMPGMTYTPH